MKERAEELNLDDPALYREYDPAGMFRHLGQTPDQCQRAWKTAGEFQLPEDYSEVNKVIILGMGGSAIGGDLMNRLVAAKAKLPIIVHRNDELPGFVDPETLVIASSYSGNTGETLAAFRRALKSGAKTLAITTGGQLKDMAATEGIPIFSFDYPCQPRAALPYSFLPVLKIMQKLGLVKDRRWKVTETVAVLKSLSRKVNEKVPSEQNPAKQLALKLHRRLPVIYGAGITAAVAQRWKTQLNENAKAWAFSEVFPELGHNAVAGYQFPPELARKIMVVLLSSPLLARAMKRRYQITIRLLKEAKIDYLQVALEGADPLSQVMSLVLLGDYLSAYLALLYRVDPTPIKAIDYLKEQMGQNT